MLRLLILFGITFYGVMIVFGEDQGQLRAGLRDAPMATDPAAAPVVVADSAEAPPAAPVVAVPDQAQRILPMPQDNAATQPSPMPTAVELAEQALLQTASIPIEIATETVTETVTGTDLPATATLRWVAVESANVRAQPGRYGAIAGRVERNDVVQVLWMEDNGWARIRMEGDGADGFVFGDLLTDVEPSLN
jgi:NADPH-dependent ferric siderophore reductase